MLQEENHHTRKVCSTKHITIFAITLFYFRSNKGLSSKSIPKLFRKIYGLAFNDYTKEPLFPRSCIITFCMVVQRKNR